MEENNKQHFIGDQELSRLYEELRKKEAELEELKAEQRLIERIVACLEKHQDEWRSEN